VFDGEEPPQWGPDDLLASEVAALLRNGQGGIDWTALPFVVRWLNVRDVDMLCRRLRIMLLYRPPPEP
jgi:hypothetical protein